MKLKLLIFLFLFSLKLSAQDSIYKFTLQHAIEYAYQNQANVKNAMLDEQIAKQKVNEITGMGTPQIKGEFDINDYLKLPVTILPEDFAFGGSREIAFGTRYTSTAGISATQLLFDGSYLVGLKASKTYLELSRKQTQQTKIETSIAVSKAYYNVLVNNERMKLVLSNETRLKKLRDDTKAMFDNGVVEKIDADRAELAYNNIMIQKQNVERLTKLGYALLKFQIGLDQNANIELADELDENKWADMSMPDQADYNKRNEYSLLQTQEHFQELDLKRYRSQYLPSLVAFGNLNTTASRDEFTIFDTQYRWFPMSVIGIKLSVPIWDGLQTRSRVQQSKLAVYKVRNSMENLKQGISFEYSTAKANFQNNMAELEHSKRNRELASEIARVTKIKYDNGVGSSLEVVDAEASLKESETNYFNSLYNTIISKLDIDKALGNIK